MRLLFLDDDLGRRWLCEHPEKWPSVVVVHSWNLVGGKRMVERMIDAGMSPVRILEGHRDRSSVYVRGGVVTPSSAVYKAFLEVQEVEIKRRKHEDKPLVEGEVYYRVPETIAVGSGTVWFSEIFIRAPLTLEERRHARNVWILWRQAGL